MDGSTRNPGLKPRPRCARIGAVVSVTILNANNRRLAFMPESYPASGRSALMPGKLRRTLALASILAAAALSVGAARAEHRHDNGLARTPPMGWNSWNHFGCDVSAKLIRDVADAMAASGMRDAGYQ